MAKIIGSPALNAKLTKLAQGADVTASLLRGAEATRARYVESINEGGGSGEQHVVSAPGQPPNTDTGRLVGSTGSQSERRNQAETYATAEYASLLEFGTERMAPRPAMAPAFDRTKAAVIADVTRTIERTLK